MHTINIPRIPRQSRGFFICGHSSRILACASRHTSTVCQPRRFCYLSPVNGLFRSSAWSVALLLCLAHTGVKYTPVSSLHFSCCVHVVPSAPEFPISVFVFQFRKLLVSIRRLFPFRIPMNLDTLSLAASPSACGCGLGTSPLRCS